MSKFKTFYCRAFQCFMKLANYVVPYRTPEVYSGFGEVKQLPARVKEKGVNNVLVVTDPGIMKIGLMNGLIEALDASPLKYTLFYDIQANPTDENVEKGYAAFKQNGCGGIIAFGGGSAMDCAKAIAAKNAHPRRPVSSMQGAMRVLKRVCPLWAVPTTAGTGSETTVAAVITEASTHHKKSINDPVLMPRWAVLDAELTVGLPPFITATTGMDALCHAVESYTNYTYLTKYEKELSKKAVKLIHDNLYKAYTDGGDIQARQSMLEAAFCAGRSFTRGCVGNVHALGHTLSGLYGVPHGLAMSIILPHALRFYGSRVYKRLSELADACGIGGADERQKAENFIGWIEEMKRKMEIPDKFNGFKESDIPQIIAWADKEANPLYPVPMVLDREGFSALIDEIRE